MQTVFQAKEQSITDAPLLLFECALRDGQVERWCSHRAEVEGNTYEARVLQHNLFEIQTSSDQGVDAIPRVSLVLANADSHFSELERTVGWKGAKLAARFVFYDLRGNKAATESTVVFLGVANPPDEVTQGTFRLTAINRMSMQRVLLPEVRIQRRCPWEFPTTAEQRTESVHGGDAGRYSRFFRCGYSVDVTDGAGTLNGDAPFTSCGYTRGDCEARGMFGTDSAGRVTRRFGGIEFVPASILVRGYGEKGTHASAVISNEAHYNDFVPIVYGTAWYAPPVVTARNDGNLTHMEVLLGQGEMAGVLKVLVNDIEIPIGGNSTGTGWCNVVSLGNRTGNINLDLPGGDPYGSMGYLSVVVPNRINDGGSMPTVKVLAQGVKLPVYDNDGSYIDERFTANPVWVLLDVLRRSGWGSGEIDFASFAQTAAVCDERIQVKDANGNPVSVPRFECNLAVQKRRSAGDLARGIRNAARLYLTYGAGGMLQAGVEDTLAAQQPDKADWSNSTEVLDGGWPSYEFSESNITRRSNGEPAIRLFSRSTADTPNRLSVEFQDAFNEYQQDSFSLVDVDDIAQTGQEIAASLAALGVPHFDQAARILKFNLDRSIRGNTYIEFETSVKALGLRPGDLIALSYLKEGFERQPFRVLKIAPGSNYRTARITAQIHSDQWYEDTNGQAENPGGRRQNGYGVGLPRPLIGTLLDANGEAQFDITETAEQSTDGRQTLEATVQFQPPAAPSTGGPGIPLVSLAAVIGQEGTLAGDQTLYYAVSGADSDRRESALSFIVRASIPVGADSNSVTLTGLSFGAGTTAFHVYRGPSPAELRRIASDQEISDQFTDAGLEPQAVPPPDPNYDHANFYWRLEHQPESAATVHTADTVGNGSLEMKPNQYRGMTVRIAQGRGAGQERTILANTASTVTVASEWSVEPDASSTFVVAEAGWHFGAMAKSSPVTFEIPNRTGAVVHISGRAANVNDQECAPEISGVTRWTVGGAGHGDADVPPAPTFGLGLAGRGGTLELSGVSFQDLANTRTIAAGSITLYYWNELDGETKFALAADMDASGDVVSLTTAGPAKAGSLLQIDGEILRVEELLQGGLQYRVTRGTTDSTAQAHSAGAAVYHLSNRLAVVPFAQGFFGSPASGSWSYTIDLPDVRVAGADMFVTNANGNGPAASICVTQTTEYGLRTLSGGQYTFQVDGYLAIDSAPVPDIVVENTHAVRDVFAVVKQAPVGSPVSLVVSCGNRTVCELAIPDGALISNVANGFGWSPLSTEERLSLQVTGVGATTPGADLTVILRL